MPLYTNRPIIRLLTRAVLICLAVWCWLVLAPSSRAAASLTLGWQPSTDYGVAGYRLYYGTVSHVYTNLVAVGTNAIATVSNLVPGLTYYFAVTVYGTDGSESAPSAEISYTVPAAVPPGLQIVRNTAGQPVLRLQGAPGQVCDLLAAPDYHTWTVIQTVTLPASGTLDVSDPNQQQFPSRFYRLRGY